MLRLTKDEVWPAVSTPPVFVRETHLPKRFGRGDKIRVKTLHPVGHTRLPRYARGHVGVVQAYRGTFLFPDTNAHGAGESPQHLYNVRFEAKELWGDAAADRQCVYLDLWDNYIEDAAGSDRG